jgi:predicted MFS family arabinose efflux permease
MSLWLFHKPGRHKEKAHKAVSKVFVGVSAGMVLGVLVTSFIARKFVSWRC